MSGVVSGRVSGGAPRAGCRAGHGYRRPTLRDGCRGCVDAAGQPSPPRCAHGHALRVDRPVVVDASPLEASPPTSGRVGPAERPGVGAAPSVPAFPKRALPCPIRSARTSCRVVPDTTAGGSLRRDEVWWLPIIGPTATVSTPRLRVGAPPEPLTLVGHHVDAEFLSQTFTRRVDGLSVGWRCCRSPSSASARRPTSCPASPSRSTTTTPAPARPTGCGSGGGAERLGLVGQVAGDDLRAVLAGIAPGTGGLTPNGETIRPHPRRVPGFDLTFKAPKSVSVLYAVSDDPRVQGAIIEAGEAAVRGALGWLEREAIHVRRGTGNERSSTTSPPATRRRRAAAVRDAADAGRRRRGVPASHLAGPATRCCTGTRSSPTSPKGPTAGGSAFVHPDLYRHGARRGRGVPDRAARRAHPAAGRRVAARAPRPRDRRRPAGAVRRF